MLVRSSETHGHGEAELTVGRAGPIPGHRSPGAAEGSPATAITIAEPEPYAMTSEKVMTNVNTVSTPVYDSDRTAALEVIPSSAGHPPRHLDIYGQLCWEFGADPRSSDFGSLPPHHRANAFPHPSDPIVSANRTSTRPGPGASALARARPRPGPGARPRPRTPCPGGTGRCS